MESKITFYANQIAAIFKREFEPVTDHDLFTTLQIENILISFEEEIQSSKPTISKFNDPISIVTFQSRYGVSVSPNFQIWKRNETRIIVDAELSKNPDISPDEWSVVVHDCQCVLDELNENKIRKGLRAVFDDVKVIAIEQFERSKLKEIPMFNSFNNRTSF